MRSAGAVHSASSVRSVRSGGAASPAALGAGTYLDGVLASSPVLEPLGYPDYDTAAKPYITKS